MRCLEEVHARWRGSGGAGAAWWGPAGPPAGQSHAARSPHHPPRLTRSEESVASVGISCAKEGDAAERTGGWLGGPYQSGSRIFSSPTALFSNPCRSSLPFFFFFHLFLPVSLSPSPSTPLCICVSYFPATLHPPTPSSPSSRLFSSLSLSPPSLHSPSSFLSRPADSNPSIARW